MDERSARRQRLQYKMKETGIDVCVITQNVDLYYFVGSMQTGYLFVPAEGEAIFYVRRSVARAAWEADVTVVELGSMRGFGARLAEALPHVFRKPGGEAPIAAAEYDVLPVQQFQRLEGALPGVKWVDGSTLIREIRMIKSPLEIAAIRESARIVDIAYETAVQSLRPGMPEVELMAIVESVIRKQGHMGLMRVRGYNQEIITGMVGAGEAAAMPTYFDGPAGGQGLGPASPQSSGRRPIGENEPILIDIGCCVEGYVIDQTRTAVIGELPADLRQAYELAERVLRETESRLKPGTICEELYAAALEQVREAGLGDHFMGFGGDQVKFLGHGIGLEIDELPVLAKGFRYPLEAGMVIAIEPKFTFPGRGVVGIENTYAITESGFEKLTVSREGIAAAPGSRA
ncbi:M24 family metallopeptidase [Paenibacillus sp. GYB003]|uniref:M24 family metallopeptidase n=1 Tax=Paenibacillus sp. GYB003 TaxID=2994392 RepID=UPI002F961EA3